MGFARTNHLAIRGRTGQERGTESPDTIPNSSMSLPTLAEHDDTLHKMFVCCTKCGHHADLDIKELLERFPPDMACVDLNGLFRCGDCGHLGGTIRVRPRRTGPDAD